MKQWFQELASHGLRVTGRGAVDAGALSHKRRIKSSPHRQKGDLARDNRAWPEAIQHYEEHLKIRPEDAAIWVQLGHARKELQDTTGAEDAYRQAVGHAPDNADAMFQLGQLLRAAGRGREAVEALSAALLLEPSGQAYRELVGMGQKERADRLLGGLTASGTDSVIYLQINDLLQFLQNHRTPSGIQRVQLGILEYGLTGRRGKDEPRVEFVFNQPEDVRVWKAARPKLQALVDYLDGVDLSQATLRGLVLDILENATLVKPGKHDCFIVLGAFWGVPGNTKLLASLRAQGARLGIYLYDLIPITCPEYCAHQLTVDFTADLCEALQLIDFAFAISEFTAREIRAFIAEHGFPAIPVEAVPLAHSLTGSHRAGPALEDWSAAIARFQHRAFVLCVCTIEPRKNHRYLYDAWKALKQDGVAVPDLVLVGRRGWYMDDFFAQLDNSDYLGGSITILHDLSDTELATLYRACRFTVFPSIVEGWGLPLGESLVYGKLCVASNVTSMPEVGGDLVEYIDPYNLRAGIATLRGLIEQPEKVTAWEARIQAEFRPRSWEDVSKQFLTATARLTGEAADDVPRAAPVAALRSGELVHVGTLARSSKLQPIQHYKRLQRLTLADGWCPPEGYGARMKARRASLYFTTGLAEGTGIVVFLQVAAADLTGLTLEIAGGALPVSLSLEPRYAETVRFLATVGARGDLVLELSVTETQRADDNQYLLSLAAIGFADTAATVDRAELLEQVLISRNVPPPDGRKPLIG